MTDGSSPYSDDAESIPPGTHLIRRINPRFCDWDDLDAAGNPRITRQAVQFYRDEEAQRLGCPGPAMSFVLESRTTDIGEMVRHHPGYGLARISTDELRTGGALGVQPWPTDEDSAHVVAFRRDGGSKPTSAQAKRIAHSLSQGWVLSPDRPVDTQ